MFFAKRNNVEMIIKLALLPLHSTKNFAVNIICLEILEVHGIYVTNIELNNMKKTCMDKRACNPRHCMYCWISGSPGPRFLCQSFI